MKRVCNRVPTYNTLGKSDGPEEGKGRYILISMSMLSGNSKRSVLRVLMWALPYYFASNVWSIQFMVDE